MPIRALSLQVTIVTNDEKLHRKYDFSKQGYTGMHNSYDNS